MRENVCLGLPLQTFSGGSTLKDRKYGLELERVREEEREREDEMERERWREREREIEGVSRNCMSK